MLRLVAALGQGALDFTAHAGGMALVFGRVVRCLVPPRFDSAELLRSGVRFGWSSLPIVVATALFTGGIMVLQSLPYVQQMQAMALLPWATAFSTLREVGPVL